MALVFFPLPLIPAHELRQSSSSSKRAERALAKGEAPGARERAADERGRESVGDVSCRVVPLRRRGDVDDLAEHPHPGVPPEIHVGSDSPRTNDGFGCFESRAPSAPLLLLVVSRLSKVGFEARSPPVAFNVGISTRMLQREVGENFEEGGGGRRGKQKKVGAQNLYRTSSMNIPSNIPIEVHAQ